MRTSHMKQRGFSRFLYAAAESLTNKPWHSPPTYQQLRYNSVATHWNLLLEAGPTIFSGEPAGGIFNGEIREIFGI